MTQRRSGAVAEMDLSRLREPFEPSEIEWRVGATNKDKLKGIALPYITNRAVQNRLDEVCGAGNWWNEFKQWGEKSQLCGITILIDDRPVTKWDGADNTNVDPTKGGLSNSMKRAAAQWGIGRYLYDLPACWVDIQPVGKSYKIIKPPLLPKDALPKNFTGQQNFAEGDALNNDAQTLEDFLNNNSSDRNEIINEDMANNLTDALEDYEEKRMLKVSDVWKYFNVRSAFELTNAQYAICLRILNQKDKNEEKKKK